MNARSFVLVLSVSALAVISACSASPPRNDSAVAPAPAPAYNNATQFGYVSGIDVVPVASRTSGGGAVLGAVLGAVIGNQIEKRNKSESDIYRVSVRLDNGSTGQFDYQRIDDLRVGDRVRVEAGQLHRV